MKLQKLGGYVAIVGVCVYIIDVTFAILRLGQFGDLTDPLKTLAAFAAAPADFYAINLLSIIYNILWLVWIYILHERMRTTAPHLTRMALLAASAGTVVAITQASISTKVIGMIIQTNDVSAIRATNAVYAGMDILYNHTYGWACLLIGLAILKTRVFSRTPGWLFLLPGILYVLMSSYPMGFKLLAWGGVVAWIFMLFSLIAIVWLGIAMLREKSPAPQPAK
jgi:hypothetical protein